VAVVGGGLAGLSAAIACADAGAKVTLFESRPRLGGATWSFRRNGRWFDNGQHVFLRCFTAYRAFLARIGSASSAQLQDRLAVPVVAPGAKTAWIRRNGLPAPFQLAFSLARYRHLSAGGRARLGRTVLALRRLDLDDPRLDEVSFGDWLAAQHQSVATTQALWDVICRPTVNLPAEEASLAMAAKVFQTGFLTDRSSGDIGWAKVPLAHLHGEPAARALERAGATVNLRAKVESVDQRDGGWVVVADGRSVAADAVIVAVPHDAAGRLLPPQAVAHQPRIGELGASPIVNVQFIYDRRVTDLPFAAGLHSPVQFVFDRTQAAGGHAGEQALTVSLSAAGEWIGRKPDELIDCFTAALADLFPDARHAQVLDAVVTRERAATFAARPATGALRPSQRTRLRGLAVAGAWTDTGWPATMEGAVRSGATAALLAGGSPGRAAA
jgi:squalene-associated FAD-dependent desaturase